MRYREFTAVADDGADIRIRETWPEDPASDVSPGYEVVGPPAAVGAAVEVLPGGRYRVDGKTYTAFVYSSDPQLSR